MTTLCVRRIHSSGQPRRRRFYRLSRNHADLSPRVAQQPAWILAKTRKGVHAGRRAAGGAELVGNTFDEDRAQRLSGHTRDPDFDDDRNSEYFTNADFAAKKSSWSGRRDLNPGPLAPQPESTLETRGLNLTTWQ